MRLPASCVLSLSALLCWSPASADSNFAGNPRLPFPPSCATEMDTYRERGVRVLTKDIQLHDRLENESVPFVFSIYRAPCSERDRSLILAELHPADIWAGREFEVALPWIRATPEGTDYEFILVPVTEPNGWSAWGNLEQQQAFLVSRSRAIEDSTMVIDPELRWRFLLVNTPSLYWSDPSWGSWWGISPSKYNGALRLVFGTSFDTWEIDVPSTSSLWQTVSEPLPLSGRHSGTWVVDGASDQGFQLSFSEQVGPRANFESAIPDLPLVVFLSQYTFDAAGRPLWLVGNVEIWPGATEVTMPVYRVTDGRFRGERPAQRELAGEVTLRSRSCNDVEFAYDYAAIGLGAGSRRLVRLFSLETAGYDCRDYEARVDANR